MPPSSRDHRLEMGQIAGPLISFVIARKGGKSEKYKFSPNSFCPLREREVLLRVGVEEVLFQNSKEAD